jgi:5'-nucleotidase/2',3'-cyclic phosphodiesterase and related esterases
MNWLPKSATLALLATMGMASWQVQAYEQDKTYNVTILHTNDHHGHFWRSDYGEYGLSAQRRWWTAFVKRWLPKVAVYCYSPAATSILVYPNPIYRMLNRIFAA